MTDNDMTLKEALSILKSGMPDLNDLQPKAINVAIREIEMTIDNQ